uniref:Uncharacterized protein n=1 Tax=Panagrellus redivivus TaxID=6233 RepID=A0A7E4VSR0_PANRE
MYYRIISIVTLLSIVNGEVCHIGSPRDFGHTIGCGPTHAGCAVVRYDRDIQEYGLNDRQLNVHSMCMTKIQPLHPVFAVMDCANSHREATCYDQNTRDEIEFELKSIGVREQTIGEILRLHGINSICCCKGVACNKANPQMIDFFSQHKQGRKEVLEETFKETMDMSYYPGGQDQPKTIQPPHHHKHHHHGKPSSAVALSTCAFMLLVAILL